MPPRPIVDIDLFRAGCKRPNENKLTLKGVRHGYYFKRSTFVSVTKNSKAIHDKA